MDFMTCLYTVGRFQCTFGALYIIKTEKYANIIHFFIQMIESVDPCSKVLCGPVNEV